MFYPQLIGSLNVFLGARESIEKRYYQDSNKHLTLSYIQIHWTLLQLSDPAFIQWAVYCHENTSFFYSSSNKIQNCL